VLIFCVWSADYVADKQFLLMFIPFASIAGNRCWQQAVSL